MLTVLSMLTSPARAIPPFLENEPVTEVIVSAPYVDVHTGPGRGYPVFHVVEFGQTLKLIKRRTGWVKIETGRGKQGWVRISDLDRLETQSGETIAIRQPDARDFRASRVHLGFSTGQFGGASTLGLTLGYRFTANLSAEVRATQAVGDYSNSQTFQVAAKHQPFPDWKISPYFAMGAGINSTAPNATIIAAEDRNDTAMLAAVGASMYLSRRFVLRAEYTNHYLLTSREENQEVNEWKLGIDVFF
ncbi:outer membrane beta-barrel protein [Biformimicrobium ophioploci]|uniref:SH3b domain-containing protein n=1 Tax=Biformimicrobium ophioploci TaxID=3036711 RepID=A0ABQ6M161_9GAMM|nr:SH3 domain-containing protein [Microbulbifer sp. NKW57]GMG88079.1 hypothetical protein MNKW57_24000 [Microbulbifer sp. NKW57]